jgi:UDP-N-acetylglucosamine 2-epimerase (non-hydrolysing)
MPEEKYRTMIDHLSDVIYAYLPPYRDNGILEGIYPGRIVVTGNPIVDVLNEHFLAKKSESGRNEVLSRYSVAADEYFVMTSHRRENVDQAETLNNVLKLASKSPGPVLFFAGYRTQQRMTQFGIRVKENIRVFDPVGYRELLYLIDSSRAVLTDSGTVVEEACILGKPSVQMRYSTERPEVYDVGASVKFDPRRTWSEEEMRSVVSAALAIRPNSWQNPFGDGTASQRIVADIRSRLSGGTDLGTHAPSYSNAHVSHAVCAHGRDDMERVSQSVRFGFP